MVHIGLTSFQHFRELRFQLYLFAKVYPITVNNRFFELTNIQFEKFVLCRQYKHDINNQDGLRHKEPDRSKVKVKIFTRISSTHRDDIRDLRSSRSTRVGREEVHAFS